MLLVEQNNNDLHKSPSTLSLGSNAFRIEQSKIALWFSISSSSDGTKLIAAADDDYLYTSTDSGISWTPRESSRAWYCTASSFDGVKLVAVVKLQYVYTSTDSGVTWAPRLRVTDTGRNWYSVASSSD